MIFPSLCLAVRSLDFGLEAATTAFTASAAAVFAQDARTKNKQEEVWGKAQPQCPIILQYIYYTPFWSLEKIHLCGEYFSLNYNLDGKGSV